MMSFERNPYPDNEDRITGTVGSVSLTKLDGTTIPMDNLPNEIVVRPARSVEVNSSNYRNTYKSWQNKII